MIRMVRPTSDELKSRHNGHWVLEGDKQIYVTTSTELPNVFTGIGGSIHASIEDYWRVIDECYDEVLSNNIAGYDLIDSPG